jgi:hypothetical protein
LGFRVCGPPVIIYDLLLGFDVPNPNSVIIAPSKHSEVLIDQNTAYRQVMGNVETRWLGLGVPLRFWYQGLGFRV